MRRNRVYARPQAVYQYRIGILMSDVTRLRLHQYKEPNDEPQYLIFDSVLIYKRLIIHLYYFNFIPGQEVRYTQLTRVTMSHLTSTETRKDKVCENIRGDTNATPRDEYCVVVLASTPTREGSLTYYCSECYTTGDPFVQITCALNEIMREVSTNGAFSVFDKHQCETITHQIRNKWQTGVWESTSEPRIITDLSNAAPMRGVSDATRQRLLSLWKAVANKTVRKEKSGVIWCDQ